MDETENTAMILFGKIGLNMSILALYNQPTGMYPLETT